MTNVNLCAKTHPILERFLVRVFINLHLETNYLYHVLSEFSGGSPSN